MKHKGKHLIGRVFVYLLLFEIAFIILFPLISKLFASFMSMDDIYDKTVRLIPRNPTLDNITAVLEETSYWESLKNTFLVSLMSAVLQTLVCALTGYGLAKLKSKLSGVVFAIVIMTILIPPQIILIPMYLRFRFFDFFGIIKLLTGNPAVLMNSLWPMLILSITGFAFKNGLYIFIMRQFYKGIPEEIEEAASIDGCGIIPGFFRIVLSMSVPMLVTIFMFSFCWQWTDTFYSGVFFSELKVLANSIFTMPSASQAGAFANNFRTNIILHTGVLLAIAPLVPVYLLAQRRLIAGVERSGLVG